MFASFDGIEIPNIASFDSMYEEIGDIDRTAGGNLRQDMTAVKSLEYPQPHHLGRAPSHKSYLLHGAEGDFGYGRTCTCRAKLVVNYPLCSLQAEVAGRRMA